MKKAGIFSLIAILLIVAVFLVVYPFIEIDTGEKLIIFNYDGDFSQYDDNHSYNELYSYNEERDISIKSFEVNNFLFFYTVSMEYIRGDFREMQHVLPESYIENFLNNAKIIENEENVELGTLIAGKTPVISNTKYSANDSASMIFYELDGNEEEMCIFYVDDLLVIRVGSPDELPKYIAYK